MNTYNSITNRIVFFTVLLTGLVGYINARPLIEIQKDLQEGFQEAYQHFNIYTENSSYSIVKVEIKKCTIPDSNQEKALHIIFYDSLNAPILSENLPLPSHDKRYQVIPTDINYVKKLLENTILLSTGTHVYSEVVRIHGKPDECRIDPYTFGKDIW